jgi:hypothetical protein
MRNHKPHEATAAITSHDSANFGFFISFTVSPFRSFFGGGGKTQEYRRA